MIGVRTTAALHAANVPRPGPRPLLKRRTPGPIAPRRPGGHSCPGGSCDVDRVHVLYNQERPSARIMRVPRLVPLRASLFQPRVQLAPERNTGGTRLSLFRLGVWARFHTELRVRIFRSMPDTTGRARFGGIRGSHPSTEPSGRYGSTGDIQADPLPRVSQGNEGYSAAATAAALRRARRRSFGSSSRLRGRIDFGVTSTSSSSAI